MVVPPSHVRAGSSGSLSAHVTAAIGHVVVVCGSSCLGSDLLGSGGSTPWARRVHSSPILAVPPVGFDCLETIHAVLIWLQWCVQQKARFDPKYFCAIGHIARCGTASNVSSLCSGPFGGGRPHWDLKWCFIGLVSADWLDAHPVAHHGGDRTDVCRPNGQSA